MAIRTPITPLGAGKKAGTVAYRSPFKLRNIEVTGTEIILRDYASSYSIDLSDKSNGSFTYTLDTSQTHKDNHEIESFEILLTLPANSVPTVSFPFIDRWVDFGGLWRLELGKSYLISVFKTDNEWVGSVNGTVTIPTKKGSLGRSIVAESESITLKDDAVTYFYTVDGDTDFSFDTTALKTNKEVLCFDLILTIGSDTPALTFPVAGWFDFGYPYLPFEQGTVYCLTFLSLDGGETWTGRYNNKL